ncbi:NAD-binding protein [uncultured Propionivibrio sp.]|uniref:potassium channel family protein n=1 Tax=uncultured Propionivibrio sp. TaxID=426737 RepID=UPI0029BFEAD1|nr:NAD-binding protein [uncultured Propionivibrio sp.]
MPFKIKPATRRLLTLLTILPTAILTLGTLYMLGMTHLEGTPRTLMEGIQWASESITNTGYGHDNHWEHPVMASFVIVTPFIGQFLIFLIFPVLVLPYFEEKFEVRLQHELPPMTDTVLFYRYGPAIESLLEEFKRAGSRFVIFEEDLELARNLRDRKYNVVFGKLADDPAALARVSEARAVVTNAGDHANATCTMIVREHGFSGPIYALADEPIYRAPMLQIGATDVFTPAHVLGAAMASRASTRISPPAEGMHLLGTQAGLAEFRVRNGSELAGKRLGDLRLREEHGVSVIGQWREGVFTTTKGPETLIDSGAILVVVGPPQQLEKVGRMAMPIRRDGPIVLAGFGAVGRKVIEMLHDAGENCVVIDLQPGPGVDVVGNVLDNATLARAGVANASAIVLALADDSEAVFATAVVRDQAPEVPLIVRVNRTPNTARIYKAGADFAISQGQVAGQILAYHLLDEQIIPVESRIKFSRQNPGTLVGSHPWHNETLEQTGTKIVAVERSQKVLIEFDDSFRIHANDVLYACGSLNSLERYQRQFQTGPTATRH